MTDRSGQSIAEAGGVSEVILTDRDQDEASTDELVSHSIHGPGVDVEISVSLRAVRAGEGLLEQGLQYERA